MPDATAYILPGGALLFAFAVIAAAKLSKRSLVRRHAKSRVATMAAPASHSPAENSAYLERLLKAIRDAVLGVEQPTGRARERADH